MHEYLPPNRHRLNQEAKRHLLAVGEVSDQGSLYVLQFLLWGLQESGLEVDPRWSEALENQVAGLLAWRGASVQRFLLSEGEPSLSGMSASEAAAELLDHLHGLLLAHHPVYRWHLGGHLA